MMKAVAFIVRSLDAGKPLGVTVPVTPGKHSPRRINTGTRGYGPGSSRRRDLSSCTGSDPASPTAPAEQRTRHGIHRRTSRRTDGSLLFSRADQRNGVRDSYCRADWAQPRRASFD